MRNLNYQACNGLNDFAREMGFEKDDEGFGQAFASRAFAKWRDLGRVLGPHLMVPVFGHQILVMWLVGLSTSSLIRSMLGRAIQTERPWRWRAGELSYWMRKRSE